MDDITHQLLVKYKQKALREDGFNDDYYIFSGIIPLSVNIPSNALYAGISASGVNRIRLHDFRHSHASLLVASGLSIKSIATRLGDKVETVLKVYVHDNIKATQELNDTIDTLSKVGKM
ncbi:MAG: hypothetical protein ACK5KR_03865 [Breznakia sp.]